jgi:hypothetical protein
MFGDLHPGLKPLSTHSGDGNLGTTDGVMTYYGYDGRLSYLHLHVPQFLSLQTHSVIILNQHNYQNFTILFGLDVLRAIGMHT